jgi:hypothetical protein
MTDGAPAQELPPELARAFAPADKRAFGVAIGLVCAAIIFAVTAIYLLRHPQPGFNLALFGQFFYGYSVSWSGALVGAAWGLFAGFIVGWFFAFGRNLFLATWLLVVRERAAREATRDFLDHI